MARAALACGAQGIMVEIHPQPADALSDGPQALRFETFQKLMASITTLRSEELVTDSASA